MLFEMLILEGAQAGLSWQTILNRRQGYRLAYHDFDAEIVAKFDANDVARLLADVSIIRNRAKIRSSIENAKAFLKIKEGFGSFANYQWRFVDGVPKQNAWKSLAEVPASTTESQAFSKDLKERGFTFVGPTIIYAHMQAVGMVNDHLVNCPRWTELQSA